MCLFFFKQKTAYEMRISDWSSDVCSSDLPRRRELELRLVEPGGGAGAGFGEPALSAGLALEVAHRRHRLAEFRLALAKRGAHRVDLVAHGRDPGVGDLQLQPVGVGVQAEQQDRKSTRLNSSH